MNLSSEALYIEGLHYKTGEPVSIKAIDGIIAELKALPAAAGKRLPWIGPGLVDLQINGYRGLDFNTVPLEQEDVHRISQELWSEGVTAYLPTVITNGDEEIELIVSTISAACDSDPITAQCVAGIHLEGPFISPEDGARGAHGKQYVKPPDWDLFQRWQDASGHKIRMITLSPEWPESLGFIEKCTEDDVIVSIGHTSATPEQIRSAVSAGARMSTHLGNGAHLMLPRHPNYIWEQLAQDELWACLIADGFHLPDAFMKVALRTKGARSMIVSDAVSLSGMPAGVYDLHIGGKVVLTKEGKLHLHDNPNILAGSAQMLVSGINHLVKNGICELQEAWEMASIRPASFIGLNSKHGLHEGSPADLVLFTCEEEKVTVRETYKNGRLVYRHD